VTDGAPGRDNKVSYLVLIASSFRKSSLLSDSLFFVLNPR